MGLKDLGELPIDILGSWNPLSTKVKLINKEGDQPSYNYVKNEILDFLNNFYEKK